jgi:hypothetical protein
MFCLKRPVEVPAPFPKTAGEWMFIPQKYDFFWLVVDLPL